MQRSQEEVLYADNSERLRQIDEQITHNEALLERHMDQLSDNAKRSIKHESIKWNLREARRQYTAINTEYHRILITEGTKLKQTSSITVLEEPKFEPEQISPRKKAALIASTMLGLFFGFTLFYIRLFFDQTYYIPEEVGQDLELPILAVIPQDPPPPPSRMDRLVMNLFKPFRCFRKKKK